MWMLHVYDQGTIKGLLITLVLLCSNFVNSSVFYCNDQVYRIETPTLYFSDEGNGESSITELVYIDKEYACEPKEYLKHKSLGKTKSIVTYESSLCSLYTQATYAYNISSARNILFIVEQGKEGYRSHIKSNILPIMAFEVGHKDFNLLGCKYQSSELFPGDNKWDDLRKSSIFSIFQYLLTVISISLILFSLFLLYFVHFKLKKFKVLYILLVMGIIDSACRLAYSLDILNSKGLYPMIVSNLFSLGIIFSPIIISYIYIHYFKSILSISTYQMKPTQRDSLLKKKSNVIMGIGFSIVYIGIIGFSITTAIKMDSFSHTLYKIQIILSSCLYIVLSLSKIGVIVYYILSKHFQTHYLKLSDQELSTSQSTISITEVLKSVGISSKFLIGSTVLMVLTEIVTAILIIVSTRLNVWTFYVRILLSLGVCYSLSIVQFSILLTACLTSLRILRYMNKGDKEDHVEMNNIESKNESRTPFNKLNQTKDFDKIDILLKKNKMKSMNTVKIDIEKDLLKYRSNDLTKMKPNMKQVSNKSKPSKSETAFSDKIVLDDDVNIFVGKV